MQPLIDLLAGICIILIQMGWLGLFVILGFFWVISLFWHRRDQ